MNRRMHPPSTESIFPHKRRSPLFTPEKKTKDAESAIIVGVITPQESRFDVRDHLNELEQLARTAGADVTDRVTQSLNSPDPSTFIGSGKVKELKRLSSKRDSDLIIFDDDLSPVQVRNIEKQVDCKLLDRSGLILDIFASRAQTAAAKTQVELAQLDYLSSRLTRRWTLFAWLFLSIGILLGGLWAYEVLGWGGYWAWDPVENASFMPWLAATAYLHSVMIQEKRDMLKTWNLTLVIGTFCLTLFGTFLTRSGVLDSVHAFTEGAIGPIFLGFIAVIVLASIGLVAWRSDRLHAPGTLDGTVSRESAFVVNNLLFVALTFTVLLGTVFPLVVEAARGDRVSVGAPYFDMVSAPIGLLLLFLMGVGPALPWGRASGEMLRKRFAVPAAVGLAVVAATLALGVRQVYPVLTFGLAGFVVATIVDEFRKGMDARRRISGARGPKALWELLMKNRRRYGGYVVHFGIVVIVVAISVSRTWRFEREVTVNRGQEARVGDYQVRLDEVWGEDQPQRYVVGSTFTVLQDGEPLGQLRPRLNFYPNSDQPIATPAVRSSPEEDLYLTLLAYDSEEGRHATLRAIVNPGVPWLWIGGLIVGLGAVLAIWPRPGRKGRQVALPHRAPAARAIPTAKRPMGPQPTTATERPETSVCSTVWKALPRGSKTAAWSSSTASGRGMRLVDGTTTYSAKAPSRSMPRMAVSRQTWASPVRHSSQWPQTRCPSADTRWPTSTFVTSDPVSATSPMNSWPSTSGGRIRSRDHRSQSWMWRSVPQIPARRTRIRTSSWPGSGRSTSRTSRPGSGELLTMAFIVYGNSACRWPGESYAFSRALLSRAAVTTSVSTAIVTRSGPGRSGRPWSPGTRRSRRGQATRPGHALRAANQVQIGVPHLLHHHVQTAPTGLDLPRHEARSAVGMPERMAGHLLLDTRPFARRVERGLDRTNDASRQAGWESFDSR